MTPEDLAYQQLVAAWVSAGAAVVQAIGAVAAIISAVHLARSAERRASEVQLNSLKREREAEIARTNEPIRLAIRLLGNIERELVNQIANLSAMNLDELPNYSYNSRAVAHAQEMLTDLSKKIFNAEASLVLAQSSERLRALTANPEFASPPLVIRRLSRYLNEFNDLSAKLSELVAS
ncbi:hypothetical protein [Muricoccus nepalensis]|uniref:hypothetical protein n=1 Tax=Muricoccus nepalensis TaxID=1854500 RepID=UPI00112B10CD|nr:hypothetical protein [Roseomonas nepalensis]